MPLARYNLVVTDEDGNKMDGVGVRVERESDASLAQLFSDRNGTVALGNPFTAADGADAGFYIGDGTYKIIATLGAFSRTWRYVDIVSAVPKAVASYETIAEVADSRVHPDVQCIMVTGFASVFDSPPAKWIRAASEPTHFGKVQSDDGAWWEIERTQWIYPSMLGSVGLSNHTTFITNLFNMLIEWESGWRACFDQGATYLLWAGVSSFVQLPIFSGMDDWVLDFNGAKFKTMYTNGSFQAVIFQINDCKRWKLHNGNIEMNVPLRDVAFGNIGITIKYNCEDFEVLNYRQIGGHRGFAIIRDFDDLVNDRVRRYKYSGYQEDVYYNISLQGDGDLGHIVHEGVDGGRTFSFAGGRGLFAHVKSTPSNAISEDFIIGTLGNYTGSGFIDATEDFELIYECTNTSAGGAGVAFSLSSQSTANAPAIIRNGRVRLNLIAEGGDFARIIETIASKRDGSNNVISGDAAGYEMSNIVVEGNVSGDATAAFAEIGRTGNGFTSATLIDMTVQNLFAPDVTTDFAVGQFARVTGFKIEAAAADLDIASQSATLFNGSHLNFSNFKGSIEPNGIRTKQSVNNVHDTTPTDAELDTAFGTPATLGRGFVATIDDNDGNTNGYLVWTSDASWYWLKGTKAL